MIDHIKVGRFIQTALKDIQNTYIYVLVEVSKDICLLVTPNYKKYYQVQMLHVSKPLV